MIYNKYQQAKYKSYKVKSKGLSYGVVKNITTGQILTEKLPYAICVIKIKQYHNINPECKYKIVKP